MNPNQQPQQQFPANPQQQPGPNPPQPPTQQQQPYQQTYQQPAQNNPAPISSGQYDFINKPAKPKKQNFALGGKKKILMMVLLGATIFTFILVGFSMLSGSGGGDREILISIATKQQRIIAVSKVGADKAGGNTAKSLAYNVGLTTATDQKTFLAFLATKGKDFKVKQLGTGMDQKTEQELLTAETNGRFDEVYTNIIKIDLEEYQKILKSSFAQAQSEKVKQKIAESNDNTTLLLESIQK